MKWIYIFLFFMLAIAFYCCRKSSNENAQYTGNITLSHHWAGYMTTRLASPVGGSLGAAAFGISVTDTVFTISAKGNTLNTGFPLKYIQRPGSTNGYL